MEPDLHFKSENKLNSGNSNLSLENSNKQYHLTEWTANIVPTLDKVPDIIVSSETIYLQAFSIIVITIVLLIEKCRCFG